MAEEKTVNLVSDPPVQVRIIDGNGVMSRAWSVWFRDLYRRVAYKGGNAIDENAKNLDDLVAQVAINIEKIAKNQTDISTNAAAISLNAEGIALNLEAITLNALAIAESLLRIQQAEDDILVNTEAIEQNTSDILINSGAIVNLSSSLNDHISQTSAHGSNGDIVGFGDIANESLVGLVKRMAYIEDAVNSVVGVVSPDIGSAPALYDQAYTQTIADLSNENKAAINQVVVDLNDAIDVLNALILESINAGQMSENVIP